MTENTADKIKRIADTVATETPPTRAQLLALEQGHAVTHGGMIARRLHIDPRKPKYDVIRFAKHYLEGRIDWIVDRNAVQDMLPDPWALAAERLDQAAREQHGHHRDGRPVR